MRTLHVSVLLTLLPFAIACDAKSPNAPTSTSSPVPITPPPPPPVRVTYISPQLGSTGGATAVLIDGSGFESGAAVILGGAATDVRVLNNTTLTAKTPAHTTGPVDVVVIHANGQRGTLARAYTYADIGAGAKPFVTGVSPNIGTPGGGTYIAVTGSGFEPGAIVRLDEAVLRTYPIRSNATILNAQAAPHASGAVDVVVINPDGQTARLSRGYTYAPPGSLDFSGQWQGVADVQGNPDGSADIRFTIKDNRLTMISCNSETRVLSPPSPIVDDGFSVLQDQHVLVAGTFQSASQASGSIDVTPCGRTWSATRQD